ncbi:PREDICTED: leucine-rich repeat-containing protein 9-like [Polistes canadensis]|uniref:leucine-rich repeat-containing protein 9-like n=1 Tax=Polistes canadensis TaxID=91411 RepID=UPI000718D13B|nr:PREDICTED: leucine-rich repeat-containing protein 9-like [Polistes canadensis]
MYVLNEAYLFDTVFVAEYEYIFENDSNDNDKKEIQNLHYPATSSFEHLTRQNIILFLRINEDKFMTLQKLSLTGQNIKTLQDDSIKLPNLRELDLSYNRLEQFPNDQMIVNVNKINISFNEIRTIIIKDKLLALEVLDISWNCLTKCNENLKTLKMFSPNLKTLNIEKNQFSDIVERDKIVLLTRVYFPKLENYFDSLDSKDCKNLSLKMARNTLSEFYDRHPTIFISHRPIRRVHLKKPSMYLVRLHLNDNCISDLDGLTQEHLPRLKYLDLTNNLITSLKSLGSYNTIMELYCAHNMIRELKDIENLQNWHKLQVIDLCYNPIESAVVYKDFLVFHLIDLKYISGQCVEKSNIVETRNTFGNILNKNMLLNMNVGIKLANLRQLDVVKCSIKKINLPSNLLPHLESVDLSRNQIISMESLNTLPKLKTLRLSYNRLETFQLDRSNNFDGFPNLSTLYLDHNRIASITWDDDCNVFPTLKHLFLHHNKLSNVYGLRENSTLEILILDHNKIESIKEDSFNANNIITCLSIESNQIENLSFVKRLSRLKQLYIADNLIANEDELEKLTLLENLKELTLSGFFTVGNSDGFFTVGNSDGFITVGNTDGIFNEQLRALIHLFLR